MGCNKATRRPDWLVLCTLSAIPFCTLPNKILRSSLFALLCFAAPFTAVAQLQIQFDYSYDSSNFFSDPIRKGVLEAAASVFETRLTKETFAAITPEGSNTFALLVVDPSTEASHVIVNPILAANTLTI